MRTTRPGAPCQSPLLVSKQSSPAAGATSEMCQKPTCNTRLTVSLTPIDARRLSPDTVNRSSRLPQMNESVAIHQRFDLVGLSLFV